MMKSGSSAAVQVAEEDALRAHYYRFLSRLLAAPPDEQVLRVAAGLDGDETELGRALGSLAKVAGAMEPSEVRDEFHQLFIGIGRGELLPYASYYLTGFLNEKPLAKLRGDMARLGIERREEVKEPEDHIAAVCDMLAGLIVGDFNGPAPLEEQREFFEAHLEPWGLRFFEDLEAAESARFYMPVGTIGRVFLSIEQTAFGMEG